VRVFNEEAKKNSAEVVLVIQREEMRQLIAAVEAGMRANRRNQTWPRLLLALDKAACY